MFILRSEVVSFPNNALGDESIDCLVKVLTGPNRIAELDLTCNKVRCEGATRIGAHLTSTASAKGSYLKKLGLSLNLIGDEGCSSICAVRQHCSNWNEVLLHTRF